MKTSIPVLKDRFEILDKLRSVQTKASKNMICFYSSTIDSIITDPTFMSVSMEDKIIHRAYSVFDTTKLFGNKIFNIDSHLDRLFKSIEYISLKPIFDREYIKNVLIETAITARSIEPRKDIDLRYFYSAGLGNFSVEEDPEAHTFYVLAIAAENNKRPFDGCKEFLVDKSKLVHQTEKAKTTNYMHNCIINKISKKQGGYLGIITDSENNLLESPISNIAFVNKNDEFVVPSFEKTLRGTTVVKCMDFIESSLIKEGLVKSIVRVDTNFKDIQNGNIKEAMFVGGDFLSPILEIEGVKISNEVGPVARKLQDFLANQRTELADEIKKMLI